MISTVSPIRIEDLCGPFLCGSMIMGFYYGFFFISLCLISMTD
jgi:hypothetical protein